MAPTSHSISLQADPGIERVRSRLLTALHLGKLRPGDRVLSVRRQADLTGVNRKTVYRAYHRLADEGWLDIRPGSGTFVAESATGTGGFLTDGDLVAAVNHCRAEAASLGLAPGVFADFLQNHIGSGLRFVTIAVTECNREQIDLIAQDLVDAFGVTPRPILLQDLVQNTRRRLEGVTAVITTACHRTEVTRVTSPLGMPTYHVSLDSEFPHRLARYARLGPVLMVVRDRAFAAPFLRLLRQLSVPSEIVDRFRIVDAPGARLSLREIERGGTLYVSPRVEGGVLGPLPSTVRRVNLCWHVTQSDLERLRARLAFDLVLHKQRQKR